MKSRMLVSLLVIALVAAVMGGGTMAWFTAKADAPVNEFTAGTVMIGVDEEVVWSESDMGNVNPGDCFLKCIEVTNTGSKAIELRLDDVGFEIELNWDWLEANFDALCFATEEYDDINELKAAYEAGDFEIPLFIAPCPDSGWVMQYVKDEGEITGFEFYYTGGPVAPEETVSLCVVAVFDGEMMGNLWQGADFNQIGGTFQAVQASNDAPAEVWGEGWNWAEGLDDEAALRAGTSNAYADYFWVESVFQFADCCDQNEEDEETEPVIEQ